MTRITANHLKTRGIAAIEASLANGRLEALVSVHGANRFVVMGLAQYQHLRECELEAALAEGRADIAAGRFVVESPAVHVRSVTAVVAAQGSAKDARVAGRVADPITERPQTQSVNGATKRSAKPASRAAAKPRRR